MSEAKHRHDIKDKDWEIIGTGAPWRDLPQDYGDWKILIDGFATGVMQALEAAIKTLG